MRLYEVTALLDGNEVVIEVDATSKEDARRRVHAEYPAAHIIHVEVTLFHR